MRRTRRRAWGGLALAACVACGSPFTAAPGDGGTGGPDAAGDGGGPTDGMAPSPDSPWVDGGGNGQSISGEVVDRFLQRMPGATVTIGGTRVVADSSGTFTIGGVTTPYDAYVLTDGTQGHKHGYAFMGLTRRDPVLQLGADQRQTKGNTLTVAVNTWTGTAGVAWVDFGANASCADKTPNASMQASQITVPINLAWTGVSTPLGHAYGLEWNLLNGLPSTYALFGAGIAAPMDGVPSMTTFVPAATQPGTATMTPSFAVSQQYTVDQVTLFLRVGQDVVSGPFINDHPASAPPSYATPNIGGTSIVLCASETQATGTATPSYSDACLTGLPAGGSPNITFTPPPTFTIMQTNNVTTMTSFTWASWPTAVNVVSFTSKTSGVPAFYVVTTSGSATIPDFSAQGVALPGMMPYTADVLSISGFPNIDQAAGSTGFLAFPQALELGTGPVHTGQVGGSEVPLFTTK